MRTLVILVGLGFLASCTRRAAVSPSGSETARPPLVLAKAAAVEPLTRVRLAPLPSQRLPVGAFPTVKPRPRGTFTLVAVGDMMLGTNYPEPKYLPPGDGSQILAPMLDELRSADVTVGNLEGTLLNEGGTPKRCGNPKACYAFRSPEAYARHFGDAGFDFLSLANNHSGDFGQEGRATTKRRLDEQGIAYAGLMGTDEIAYRTIDGRRLAFVAFAPNSGTVDVRDIPRAERLVRDASANADVVIVSFHGGAEGPDAQHVTRATEEYYKEDRGNVYAFAHAVVDAGADIVVGHGPHVTRGMELYNDRLIAYSLGNFATYGRFNLRGPAGVAPLLHVTLDDDGRFVSGRAVSIYQTKPTGPMLDERHRAARLVRQLSRADFPESPLLVDEDGTLRARPL